MDRGAWQATVYRVAKSDMIEATEHTQSIGPTQVLHVHRIQILLLAGLGQEII